MAVESVTGAVTPDCFCCLAAAALETALLTCCTVCFFFVRVVAAFVDAESLDSAAGPSTMPAFATDTLFVISYNVRFLSRLRIVGGAVTLSLLRFVFAAIDAACSFCCELNIIVDFFTLSI